MPTDLVLALNEIARAYVPKARDIAPPNVRAEIVRYLTCGGDLATLSAIGQQSGKAFLYLQHEAVEVEALRSDLNAAAATPKAKPAVVPVGAAAPKDPWIASISRCRTRPPDGSLSPMQRADAAARAVEVQLERAFAKLVFGLDVSLEGLCDTISTGTAGPTNPQAAITLADDDARARTRAELGLIRNASSQERTDALAARGRVWAMTTDDITAAGGTRTLAHAIWEGRGKRDGDDWCDWFAAEGALRLARPGDNSVRSSSAAVSSSPAASGTLVDLAEGVPVYEAEAVRHIVQGLEENAQHVADIVVGPKREEWFNAESIVSLWRHSNVNDGFFVFGEQNYRKALEQTPFKPLLEDSTKIPDVVAYRVRDGADDQEDAYDVAFVIEAKVLYRSEGDAQWASSLTTLKEQLDRAKRCCSSAGAIGVVYLVSIVDGLGVSPTSFFTKVQAKITETFGDPKPTILRPAAALQGLHLRPTSFAYPATTVSVGLAAFHL